MKKKTEMGAVGSFGVLSYVTKSGTIVILIASMSGFFERNFWGETDGDLESSKGASMKYHLYILRYMHSVSLHLYLL
jgi:hypothetical protein